MNEIRDDLREMTAAELPARATSPPLSGTAHRRLLRRLIGTFAFLLFAAAIEAGADEEGAEPVYEVRPIGWIRKADGKTTIEVAQQYKPALLGVENLDTVWVLYWFDRNDTLKKRSIQQVHPRGNPENPLRGVFATRAPVYVPI